LVIIQIPFKRDIACDDIGVFVFAIRFFFMRELYRDAFQIEFLVVRIHAQRYRRSCAERGEQQVVRRRACVEAARIHGFVSG
jgi:hypothetical protein